VVTDLEHVRHWARGRNVDLVWVEGSQLRWSGGPATPDGIVADLAERIVIEPAAVATGAAVD
jgi:hypothetical protein